MSALSLYTVYTDRNYYTTGSGFSFIADIKDILKIHHRLKNSDFEYNSEAINNIDLQGFHLFSNLYLLNIRFDYNKRFPLVPNNSYQINIKTDFGFISIK
jgi:hypothetical protein